MPVCFAREQALLCCGLGLTGDRGFSLECVKGRGTEGCAMRSVNCGKERGEMGGNNQNTEAGGVR